MSPVDPDDLLPLADAAQVAGVAYSTMWRAVRDAHVEVVRIGSRDFIRREVAEAFGSPEGEGSGGA